MKQKRNKKGQNIGTIPKSLNCTYKELKIKAVVLGMPFTDVVESDTGGLSSYILNSNNKPDLTLIDKFDDWIDTQLGNAGYTSKSSLRSPRLRLGFLGEKDEEGVQKSKRVKGLKKPKKPKREKDENGLVRGTKKSYTFSLVKKGMSLNDILSEVVKLFPDASPKSITIWVRTAQKKFHEKGK